MSSFSWCQPWYLRYGCIRAAGLYSARVAGGLGFALGGFAVPSVAMSTLRLGALRGVLVSVWAFAPWLYPCTSV